MKHCEFCHKVVELNANGWGICVTCQKIVTRTIHPEEIRPEKPQYKMTSEEVSAIDNPNISQISLVGEDAKDILINELDSIWGEK
jgi:hypothetical protein